MACKYTTSMYLNVGTTICASISCSRSGSTINVWGSASVSQGNAWNLNAIYACVDGGTGWFRVKPYTNSGGSWESGFSFSFSDNNAGSRGYTVWFAVYNNAESGSVGGWDSVYVDFSYGANYTAPGTPTATNLTSDGTPHRAYSRVSANGWGTNCSRRNFEIINGGSIKASDFNNSPASMYWTLPNGSNNENAGAVITWYGRAVNNQVLWTDSGAKYIATPSAPRYSVSAGSGTDPGINFYSCNVRYKGGESNSSSANSATLKRWSFGKLTSSESGVPGTFQSDQWTSSNDVSYRWDKNQFNVGTNYKFYIRAINHLGGTASSTSNILYCPTGVAGSMYSHTTTSVTIRASYNYPGELNSATSGTMSCYQMFWGDSADNLNHETAIQAGRDFTVTGLVPAQTIYYKIKAWNVFGANNLSNVGSATTIPRYDPVIGEVSASPKTPGGDITITIAHTGGVTIDDETITAVRLEWKAASASTWTTLQSASGLALEPGDSYTFTDAWSADAPTEGDYNFRISITNAEDTISEIFTLPAPSQVRLTGVSTVANQPIQIQATATPVTAVAPYKYIFQTTGGAGTRTRTFESSASSYHVTSPNYLLFDTTYNVTATVYNAYGFWRKSATVPVTTEKRAMWKYTPANGTAQEADLGFLRNQGGGEKNIIDVYYVVANALGNVAVGDDISGKRMEFISQPLHYRPESVASITFTNGKKIAYTYDETNDDYRFGVWDGDTIETLFFDDENWLVNNYVIPAGYEVASIEHTGFGLNSSAPFSTTALVDVRPWETE